MAGAPPSLHRAGQRHYPGGQRADRRPARRVRDAAGAQDANPYTTRAYRRAAETIRGAALPVAELVKPGACASCAGSAPGSRRGCASWSRPGEIAELAELERELAPDLVGLGRYLGPEREARDRAGAGARRAHRRGASRGGGRRPAARRCRGSGRRPRRGSLEALGARGRAAPTAGPAAQPRAGAGRRASRPRSAARPPATCAAGATRASSWRSSARRPIPSRSLDAVRRRCRRSWRVIERAERRALGVTVEGVPVELVVSRPIAVRDRAAPRNRLGRVRRGARAAARAPDEAAVYAALGVPWCPPELREGPFARRAAAARRAGRRSAATCTATRRGQTGGRASRRWAARRASAATSTSRSAITRPPSARSTASTPDDVRRQAEEIAAANEVLAPFRVLRGIECDILARRPARPSRRRAGGARLGAGERARRPADAARAR